MAMGARVFNIGCKLVNLYASFRDRFHKPIFVRRKAVKEEITMVPGCDGLPLHTYVWSGWAAAALPRDFAEALVDAGYALVASICVGMVKQSPPSVLKLMRCWYMADDDGWNKAVRDLELVTQEAKKRFGVPLYLFGHSMGSILAQNLIAKRDDLFDCMMYGCWGGRLPVGGLRPANLATVFCFGSALTGG